MKFEVTTICVDRKTLSILTFPDGKTTRKETIKNDDVFLDCETLWEIEDRYEEVWNRLNPGYSNHQIFKVLEVKRV